MKANQSIRKISIHAAGCVAFLLLPFVSSPRGSIFDNWMFGPPEFKGLISSILLIIFFYTNYYYFIPQYFQQKKYFIGGLVTFFCFALILLVPHLVVDSFDFKSTFEPPDFPKHEMHPGKPNHHNKMFFMHFMFQESFFRFLVVWGLSFLLKIDKLWKQSQLEKRNAELSYLKSQVNPHFLYNTLNGIYAMSLEDSRKTPDAIVKLSELMRYVTSEIGNDYVPLKNELKYIENYIDLQKLRLGNTVDVRFQKKLSAEDYQIAPLLLIPFVENAFKYGVSNHNSMIEIQISTSENGEFVFTIENIKVVQISPDANKGTGLENVKRRLELMYIKRYELNIRNTDKKYFVELKLKLKK